MQWDHAPAAVTSLLSQNQPTIIQVSFAYDILSHQQEKKLNNVENSNR